MKKVESLAGLGYGTFEIAQSMPKGIVHRTTHSAKGLHYAINIVDIESRENTIYVGLDIGNSNTVVCVTTPDKDSADL